MNSVYAAIRKDEEIIFENVKRRKLLLAEKDALLCLIVEVPSDFENSIAFNLLEYWKDRVVEIEVEIKSLEKSDFIAGSRIRMSHKRLSDLRIAEENNQPLYDMASLTMAKQIIEDINNNPFQRFISAVKNLFKKICKRK